MLAVGGFGRRELFPFSDVDVLILIERESQAAAIKNALAEFVRLLWDCGAAPEPFGAHRGRMRRNSRWQYRAEHQPARPPHAGRFVRALRQTGNQTARHSSNARRRELIRHLCQLARERHEKFQDTLYHLEPNVKETPGGLRDLHLVHWFGKLRKPDEEVTARLLRPPGIPSFLAMFPALPGAPRSEPAELRCAGSARHAALLPVCRTGRTDARVFPQCPRRSTMKRAARSI